MENLQILLRPNTIDDLIGQHHLKELLAKIIETKDLTSLIFYGESGTGKTSTAFILAKALNKKYSSFNASIGNKQELISKINDSEILIIDEIHRLNRDKQDILLSYLEEGKITVYATTTENPYFKINPAIRSRMHILQFMKLSTQDMVEGVQLLLSKKVFDLKISLETIQDLVAFSTGDYRNVLNNLNLLNKVFKGKEVSKKELKIVVPNISFYSDRDGDSHYNNLSAFHKSLRGSDPDAALYYGAIIVTTGDIDGLFRRITAVAYEDVGLANPSMPLKVEAAFNAFNRLGMPEGILPIGNIILELALSPKSNSSYLAMNYAMSKVKEGHIYSIPKHLQDSHYKSATKLGAGIGYKYPHDFPDSYVEQQYLPKELKNQKFFVYGNSQNELKIKKFWKQIHSK